MCGIQAQDPTQAALSVRVRGSGLSEGDVAAALTQERSIVRVWAMRRTIHLVAAEDAGWLLALLAPYLLPAIARRLHQLGMDEDAARRGVAAVEATLENQRPMTRSELIAMLARRGVDVGGQRAPALLSRACLEGILCHGPPKSGKPTYVALSEWIRGTNNVPIQVGLEELVRRYLAAFGPSTARDFARWSGLPLAASRSAWLNLTQELVPFELPGGRAWALGSAVARPIAAEGQEPVVRLLPGFDAYLLGYEDRSLALDPRYARAVNAGGGMLRPTILVNGRVVGTWNHRKVHGRREFTLQPFLPLPPKAQAGLDEELLDVRRFFGERVQKPA